ncbi:MAG: hypothetical protein HKP30_05960 [Myxococcales bacterium]|nr:hypothetical protein [Myxococcales bacterium]
MPTARLPQTRGARPAPFASRILAIAAALLLVAAIAPRAGAGEPPSDWRDVASVHDGLVAFYEARGTWPRNAGALRKFATLTGRRLDTSTLSRLVVRPAGRGAVYVEYELERAKGERGFFAISMEEIGPGR